jgi:hypothetical protein
VTQYLLIYQGHMDGPMPELSQEENDAMMQAWGDWMGRVGPAVADGGALTGDHARVGGPGAPLPITGYNIVDADSIEAAKALCDGHPFLAGAPADSSVDVYELTPIRCEQPTSPPEFHPLNMPLGAGSTAQRSTVRSMTVTTSPASMPSIRRTDFLMGSA